MTFYFEKLIVWQKAYTLCRIVHALIKKFPKEEQYALTDQMRRSSLSIVSNIAEWSAGRSDPDHKHYLLSAHWSCLELATQTMLAYDFWYITEGDKQDVLERIEEIVKMLFAMRNK